MPSGEIVASARLRYLGTSAQKARLVVDLIRGKDVGDAATTLRFTKKAVARDIGRLLESAVANARQKRQDVDIDQLYVSTAMVDGGPSLKRIRPAPMGRAFRVLKRMCHVTLALGQRPAPRPAKAREAGGPDTGAGPARRRAPKAPRRTRGRRVTGRGAAKAAGSRSKRSNKAGS